MKSSKSKSIIVSLLFYVLATAIAFFAFQSFFVESHLLIRILVADIAATLFIFFGSMLLNNSSMYDPYWSVKPMVIAAGYALLVGAENLIWWQWVAFILVQLYGLRLTTNFYRDWPGFIHEDWRYVNFRVQFPKTYWLVSLGGIHFFPTVMVYLSCLPMYTIFTTGLSINMGLFILGAVILLFSVVLAFVADEQMRTFRKNPANKGKFINEKLWKYSRHPNYLGEILTWWGLYIIALAINFEYWWTGIGALAITLMFVFVSIPLLEVRSLKRRENFQEYIDSTSMLLLLPKK